MKIGGKIKELRIQKSLTQEELADRCELSKGFISQLERDLTSPSIATCSVSEPTSRNFFQRPLPNRLFSAGRTILKKSTMN